MKLLRSRRAQDAGAAGNGSGDVVPGGALAAIDELTAASSARRDPDAERRLVRLRHEAFDELERQDATPSTPEPEPDALEWVDGMPAVRPDHLSAGAVRAGILAGGCVLVRGLLTPERIEALVAGIDRSFAAVDAHQGGRAGPEDEPWFTPLALGGGAFNLAEQRQWVTSAGGVWTADSPRMTFDLIRLFGEVGLLPVISDYLGERPVASVNKWTLRRVSPGGDADWHQDGAFLGQRIRALNAWMSLSECGRDAPGLDLVPRRMNRVLETGTEGARFPWSVSPLAVAELLDGGEPVRPVFEAGDLLLFDELFLHRTANSPEMTRDRYAVETWCFGAGAYPDEQVPLVL